jgi:hypothetical protein
MPITRTPELTVLHPADRESMAHLVETMFNDFYELIDQTSDAIWLGLGTSIVKICNPKRNRTN